MTLEQQFDAIIVGHRLSSLSLTRINGQSGLFWSVTAQGDGFCGSSGYDRLNASVAVEAALSDLHAKRTPIVAIPELVLMEQAS